MCFLLLSLSVFTSNADERDELVMPESTGIRFVENVGQITDQYGSRRNDIDFKVNTSTVDVFIGNGHIHYQWRQEDKEKNQIKTYRLDVTLKGANKNAVLVKNSPNGYFEKYYNENVNDVTARSYNKITYKNVYPGIDWVLHSEDGKMKYDFVVGSSADYKNIQVEYNGATSLQHVDGRLIVATPFGTITEDRPYTYEAGMHYPLNSNYVLEGNTLSFEVSGITQNIVIDPSLEWATYFGGTAVEAGYSVTTDSSFNIYMAGRTKSSANIATSGSFQDTISGLNDGFIASYNSAGILRWATYYGGKGDDIFFSITKNTDDHLLVAGVTDTSYSLATSGTHQPNHGGGQSDCFLLKMNTSGSRVWCTYYGGTGKEQENLEYQVYVACDVNDNIYLAGTTLSDTGIATSGSNIAQSSRAGNYDAFLVKFNKNGVRQWGTYYGGTGVDNFRKITFDNSNNVYVAGEFESSGMAYGAVHQSSLKGKTECLLAKFNSGNGARIWATYYGGSEEDSPQGLGTDDGYNIYMSGSTASGTDIATTSAYQTVLNAGLSTGVYDAFLAKFDSSGNIMWGTYFGGEAVDHSGDLLIDDAGNPVFTGSTASASTISTQGAHQTSPGGNNSFDAFLAIFSPVGNKLWSSYYGDTNQDYGFGVAMIETGHIYVCGNTASVVNIAYSGSQNTLGGSNDAFLAKFTPDTSAFIFQPFTQTTHCDGDTFSLKYGTTSPFYTGNTFIVQLSDATGGFSSPQTIGSESGTTGGNILCTMPSNANGTGYRIRIVTTNPADTSYDNGNNITIYQRPAKPTATNNGPVCSNDTLKLYATTTTSNVTYTWTGISGFITTQQNPIRTSLQTGYSGNYIVSVSKNGCYRKDTTQVTIIQAPDKPVASNNGPLCTGDTLIISATNISTGTTLSWTGPSAFSSNQASPSPIYNVTLNRGGNYIFSSTSGNGCVSSDTTLVVVNQSPAAVTGSGNSPVCSGDNIVLLSSTATSGVNYYWTGPGGFSSANQNATITNAQVSQSGNYIITVNIASCYKKDTVAISVVQSPTKPLAENNSPICSGDNIELYGRNVSSGASVSWTGPGSYSSSVDSPVIMNASVTDSGDYIFTTTMNGCSKSDTTHVSVIQSVPLTLSINLVPGTVVCPTADLNFSVTPSQPNGTNYYWTGPGGWGSGSSTPTRTNVTYADSGYYKIITTNGSCSSGMDSIYVNVIDTISPPKIVTNSPVCQGDTLVLDATHAINNINRTWIKTPSGWTGSAKKITYFSADQVTHAGTYIVKAYSGGCTSYDTTVVTVKPLPQKPSLSKNSPLCEGQSLVLGSNTTTAGATYEWSGPVGFSTTTKDPSINNVTSANAGYYKSRSVLNGCYSEYDSVNVVVNLNPDPDVSSNSPVCERGLAVLYVTNPGNQNYVWRNNNASFNGSGDTVKITPTTLFNEGIYVVTATDKQTGCTGTDSIFYDIIPLPGKMTLDAESVLCTGEDLHLDATDTSTNIMYRWTGPNDYNAQTKTTSRTGVTLQDAGYYVLTASRGTCELSDSIEVTIKPTPNEPVIVTNSPLTIGDDLKLEIKNPTPGASFIWRGPNNFASQAQNPILFNIGTEAAGTYVVITTLNGCSIQGVAVVDVNIAGSEKNELVLYPNPNNGNFTVKAELLQDQEMPYEIVNAIGMIVYRNIAFSNNRLLEENVNIKDLLPSGVYVFRIIYAGEVVEIPFTVVR